MKIKKAELEVFYRAIRQAVYFFFLILMMYGMHLLAIKHKHELFEENDVVENMQFGILLFSALLFFIKSRCNKSFNPIYLICSSLCVLGCFRELDKTLDIMLPIVSWKIGYVFVLAAFSYALKNVQKAWSALIEFIDTPMFFMLCSALIVICPVGQLIGHKPFVRNVLGIMDVADIKELFEEAAETIGYTLIMLSAVESFLFKRRK